MLEISEKEVIERLHFDNPWWEEKTGIISTYQDYPKRDYFDPFYTLVTTRKVNRAVILMGPRRVGKTIMLYHAIQKLLDEGVSRYAILYLSLETPIYTGLSLEKIVLLFRNTFEHKRDSKLYIFFDEIQYLRDWEIHLKSLVDSYSSYKFIGTGSAAAALRLKSQESGAGRFTDFMLPPLTFAEYLRFINRESELITEVTDEDGDFFSQNIEVLNEEFINYLNYGGYPEAVFSELLRSNSARYIKSDIIDKVLLRDLPSLYGISDIQDLNRLFTTLAYNTGNEVSLEGLSKSSGVAKNTLRRYLEYLEAAFLIKRIYRIDQNAKRFQRAVTFKVYLTNPSMRGALFGYVDQDSEFMGALTETAIYSQWFHADDVIANLHYSRWSDGEVDMVFLEEPKYEPAWIVEVKWSDRYIDQSSELKSLFSFLDKSVKETKKINVTVTTKTKRESKLVNNRQVNFIPSSELAYMLGRNLMKYKGMRLSARLPGEESS